MLGHLPLVLDVAPLKDLGGKIPRCRHLHSNNRHSEAQATRPMREFSEGTDGRHSQGIMIGVSGENETDNNTVESP